MVASVVGGKIKVRGVATIPVEIGILKETLEFQVIDDPEKRYLLLGREGMRKLRLEHLVLNGLLVQYSSIAVDDLDKWNSTHHGSSAITPAEFLQGQNFFTGVTDSVSDFYAHVIAKNRLVVPKLDVGDLQKIRAHSVSARKEMARRVNHKGYVRSGDDPIAKGDSFYYLKTGTEYVNVCREISKSKRLWDGPYVALAIDAGRIGFKAPGYRKLRWKAVGLCRRAKGLRDDGGVVSTNAT